MKYFLPLCLLFFSTPLFSQNLKSNSKAISPLASYSQIWNEIKYSSCNTAVNATYLSKNEKDVIYILNLIRLYPALFNKTVLAKYPSVSGKYYLLMDSFYYISLVKTLQKMDARNILYSDSTCFISAKCHAYYSGITGYVGHERKTQDCIRKEKFLGECCDYGNYDALNIVLSLLIDEGVHSLGHRKICLSTYYTKIGVSIQPHTGYSNNAVLDFYN